MKREINFDLVRNVFLEKVWRVYGHDTRTGEALYSVHDVALDENNVIYEHLNSASIIVPDFDLCYWVIDNIKCGK